MYSIFGNSLSPRLAAVYNYSEASWVKLLYDEAFRIPNIYESFYESEYTHKRNPDIKPEKIKSFELAWGQKISSLFFGTLSLYRFEMHNLIDMTLDPNDGLTTFTNIGEAQGTGIEAELRYKSKDVGESFLNFSLQEAKDQVTDQILTNSPGFMIKTGWICPVFKLFIVSPEFFYETGRKTLAGNMTKEVYLVNLSLRSVKFLHYFDISFKVRNLFNYSYKYPGGYEHAQDALIQDSRSFFVQLNVKF